MRELGLDVWYRKAWSLCGGSVFNCEVWQVLYAESTNR